MDELKKSIAALSPQVAFIVNAAFAVLFLVFFLFLAMFSKFEDGGAKLISDSDAGFLFTLVWIALIILPLVAAVAPLVKKTIDTTLPILLAGIYLTFLFTLTVFFKGLGVGSILNIIIVLAPWIGFSYLRKGMPAGLQ